MVEGSAVKMKRVFLSFVFVVSLALCVSNCGTRATPVGVTTSTADPTDGTARSGATLVPATTSPAEPTPEDLGCTWTRPADGMVVVYVPEGEFEMGSNEGRRDEQPIHTVALDGFWIDRTEVTNEQYERCVEAGACDSPVASDSRTRNTYYGDSDYATYPVVKVGWPHARTYCEWAGARLPTEAEWEYAARGSDGRKYPWGNDEPDCEKANYWDPEVNCAVDTTAVGSYPAGASWCGAYDLGGNVWEWVADLHGEYPSARQVNPTGSSVGWYRVMRGGSWFNGADSMRCANRDKDPAKAWFYSVGFRCAMDSNVESGPTCPAAFQTLAVTPVASLTEIMPD